MKSRRTALKGLIGCSGAAFFRESLWGTEEIKSGFENDPLPGNWTGPWRRLFLDGSVIEQQGGVERVFHQLTKHSAEPIIVADQPWEGRSAIIGPYVYGTVRVEDDRFRLWYQLLYQGNHVGYAESSDGIRWQKPRLGLVRHEGHDTNLVVSAFQPEAFAGVHCHNPSVIFRSRETDPSRRYALYGFDSASGGPRVAFSPNGTNWTYLESENENGKPKPLFSSGDVVSFFEDPYRQRYAATWKTRNRRGRAVGIATSNDGLIWSKVYDGPVFGADDHDPDTTQIYGMPVFAYQGLFIGLPWIYRARYFRYGEYSVEKLHEAQSDSPRTMEVQLAWSWDLVHWNRPKDREQFLPRGEAGNWDSGMVLTSRAPVQVGKELWFYYSGTNRAHDEPRVQAAIGLAKMRLDGFCSMRSEKEEGWLITRREPMRSARLMINARTGSAGYIKAEVLDRKNKVVPGYSQDLCQPFCGDEVSHEIGWQSPRSPTLPDANDFKIRFLLKDAELFSYLPLDLDRKQPDLDVAIR